MAQELLGVHVFSVGTWKNQKFTAEDLGDIAKNTNALIAAGRHKPPLKLGHSGDVEIGQPALGWIEGLRAVGDKLYADFKRIPDPVFEAIKTDLYRQVSVEMSYLEEFGWILTAVALLGADLPAVKNLEDLQAYLSAHPPAGQPGAGAGAGSVLVFSLQEPIITGGPSMPDPKQEQEAERLKAREAELNERERKISFKAMFSERKAPVEAQVAAGTLTPAIRDRIVAAWEKKELTFKMGDSLDIPGELLPEIVKLSATMPRGETASADPAVGVAAEDADAELSRKAQLVMSERRGTTYEQASREVMLREPALKVRYLNILRAHVGQQEVKHGV